MDRWPQKAEADEARVILGQQQLEAEDYSASYKLLSAVSPESRRYGPTQLLLGQMFWKKYIEEKKQKGEEFDIQAPSNFRAGAIKAFETAVKALEAQRQGDEPLSESAIEARQILTQALLESAAAGRSLCGGKTVNRFLEQASAGQGRSSDAADRECRGKSKFAK